MIVIVIGGRCYERFISVEEIKQMYLWKGIAINEDDDEGKRRDLNIYCVNYMPDMVQRDFKKLQLIFTTAM